MPDLNTLIVGLGATQKGNGWIARCPVPGHTDKHPSFHVNVGKNGKPIFKCRSRCTQDEVIEALKAKGLWDHPEDKDEFPIIPAGIYPRFHRKRYTAHWPYTSPDGRVIGHVARYDGSGEKDYCPFFKANGEEWAHGYAEGKWPLFNLAELAKKPDAEIIICEGEKDAVAAGRLFPDCVATTSPGGAESAAKADWSPLAGRRVRFIWRDNNDAGIRYARDVAQCLTDVGATLVGVVIPEPLDMPPKGGAADWPTGKPLPVPMPLVSADEFLAQHGKQSSPTTTHGLHATTAPTVITAAELQRKDFSPPVWIVDGIIPEGTTLIAGKPKVGKSFFALDIAMAVARGGKALGVRTVKRRGVLYLSLEDRERRLQSRLRETIAAGEWPSNLYLATEWPRADQGGIAELQQFLDAHKDVSLIIIDVLARIRARDKGTSRDVYSNDYATIYDLKSLADKNDVSMLIVHHTRKAPGEDPFDEISGSTGIPGASDTNIILKKDSGRAKLHVRGRDVEEQELSLERGNAGGWRLLGDSNLVRMSDERKAVLEAMRSIKVPVRLSDLAKMLGKKTNTLHNLLVKLIDSGIVRQSLYGSYELTNSGVTGESDVSDESGVTGERLDSLSSRGQLTPLSNPGGESLDWLPVTAYEQLSPLSPLSPLLHNTAEPPPNEWGNVELQESPELQAGALDAKCILCRRWTGSKCTAGHAVDGISILRRCDDFEIPGGQADRSACDETVLHLLA